MSHERTIVNWDAEGSVVAYFSDFLESLTKYRNTSVREAGPGLRFESGASLCERNSA
jgi:hypothetical protein